MYTVVSTEVRSDGRPAVDELETYARAAAQLTGLEIEDAWWPGVVRHLRVLGENAARVEAVDLAEPGLGPEPGAELGSEPEPEPVSRPEPEAAGAP
jgi:hypothetical protein